MTKRFDPWYRNGLRFQCTECGRCCTGSPGYTWLNEDEIVAIANHLNLPIQAFADKYLRKVGSRWALLEHPVSFACVFLKDKKCAIYSVRPTQCRTYPWWLNNLTSKEAWEKAACECEGIQKGEPVPFEKIESSLNEQMEYEQTL